MLVEDIKRGDCLGFNALDYVVISGDMTDKGQEEGFARALDFVECLFEEFDLSAGRCILVPGNHDVQYLEDSYSWARSVKELEPQHYVKQGNVYLVRTEKYPDRFSKFASAFYHKVLQQEYPSDYGRQSDTRLFDTHKIQFLALNSCWEIDEFHPRRASIHSDAVTHVIREAEAEVKRALQEGKLEDQQKVLRIATWHHAVRGPNAMEDLAFLDRLRTSRVKVCLHGDVHELRQELVGYQHPKGQIYVVGAGSFGSPPEGRPESTPRLYNVLEISPDLSSMRVHTRSQERDGAAWDGCYQWPTNDGVGRLPYYDIALE